ncbi:hypothetical protein [Tolypothrix sp. PCC 7910]|uniref:hypothetical protein n=1 Tax=Tolypothrix sp. PCC 7910 TaxID=2099387 RepID=UPI001AD67A74|nr:hypothetical protein [Tolypothrix sp. PCC 7910]
MEDSESAKQKTKKWQPGSAQAQFGIQGTYKKFLFKKLLWVPRHHDYWWGCQQ